MTQIIIDDLPYMDATEFQVNHSSTPLDSADTSGGVGDFTVTVRRPVDPNHPVNQHGANILARKPIISKTQYGVFSGTITYVNESSDGRMLMIGGASFAGPLNVYNVRMVPYFGNLGGLLHQMCGRSGISPSNVAVDSSIADRTVVAPGWKGELWHHLKMLCAAENIQVSFTETGLRFEPVRTTAAVMGADVDHSRNVESGTMAQFVEVYEYNSRWVNNSLVYPVGGWHEEVEVLSVAHDEYKEVTLESTASLLKITPPAMVTNVPRGLTTASVYTVVGDDGFPIQPKQWSDSGGRIEFEIGEDSQSIIVKLNGPSKHIIMSNGEPSQSYALAMAADSSGSQYSSLRILGTGVLYDHEPMKFPTGITESETGNEVGVSIDNPFLSNRSKVVGAALEAARKHVGFSPSLSVTTTAVTAGGMIDGDIGARVLLHGDRPFRIRDITYGADSVNYTAEDDLTFGDLAVAHAGLTMGDLRDINDGLTMRDVLMKGAIT